CALGLRARRKMSRLNIARLGRSTNELSLARSVDRQLGGGATPTRAVSLAREEGEIAGACNIKPERLEHPSRLFFSGAATATPTHRVADVCHRAAGEIDCAYVALHLDDSSCRNTARRLLYPVASLAKNTGIAFRPGYRCAACHKQKANPDWNPLSQCSSFNTENNLLFNVRQIRQNPSRLCADIWIVILRCQCRKRLTHAAFNLDALEQCDRL